MTTIIPNELHITISTTIPGYQTINYEPFMTIPESKKKSVIFNPLVKLNESVVNKVPEDLRVKEFFDKGLFASLINSHGFQKMPSLEKATYNGYIDNNISITLNTLFSSKSLIYINEEPYVIADLQWKKGDWKIGMNEESQNKNNNSKNKLESIPDNVAYGPNYDIPNKNINNNPNSTPKKEVSQSIQKPIPEKKVPETTSKKEVSELIQKPIPEKKVPESAPELIPEPTPKNIVPESTPESAPESAPELTSKNIVPESTPEPTSESAPEPTSESAPESTPESTPESIPEPAPENTLPISNTIKESKQNTNPTPEVVLNLSQNTSDLRNELNDYYTLINSIYLNFNSDERKSIDSANSNTDLNKQTYENMVAGLRVNTNKGGGDCFFIALADAINYNNYTNPQNKIISNNYGISNIIFTQAYLRTLVYEFIKEQPAEWLNERFEIASANVDNLNTIFERQLKMLEKQNNSEDISNETYIDLVNTYYTSEDNFLVKKTDRVPIDVENYYKPYSTMNKSEIKNYIESKFYWADQIAIYAICVKLNLNTIIIKGTKNKKNNDTNLDLSIPFSHLSTTEYNNWTKYLFLYNYNNHYELITFDFKNKKTNNEKIISLTNRVSIFERNQNQIIPPIYILFVIYASYYIKLDDESKQNVSFFANFFQMIDNSVKKIISSTNEKNEKEEFVSNFKEYFPTSNLLVGGSSSDDNNFYYSIKIHLQLKKGTSLTDKEIHKYKCESKVIAINKSWATLTGQTYNPTPDYNHVSKNTTAKNEKQGGKKLTKRNKHFINKSKKCKKCKKQLTSKNR